MRLIPITVAWLGGILLGHLLWQSSLIGCATPTWAGGILACTLLAALLALRGPQGHRPAARYGLFLWLLLLGAWRYQLHPLAACAGPADLAYYNGDDRHPVWVTVEGQVAGYPDVRDKQIYYRLRASRLTAGGRALPVRGDVLVLAARWPAWRYGDRLRVTGTLEAPPELAGFDYPAYLARQGIYSRLRAGQVERVASGGPSPLAALYDLRSRGVELIDRSLPEPAPGLAAGMLLGVESGIPPAVAADFKATSTAHVIVISGSNIALFSGYLLAGLARLLGRRRAALPAMAVIILYVVLAGGDPSATRAGIMGALYIGATLAGRQSVPLLSLCAAACLMTAADPLALFDTGFQLSVLATLGLVWLAPGLQTRGRAWCQAHLPAAWAAPAADFLGDALLMTLAAQAMTVPLTICYFGRLSPISLFANFLILPVQPIILLSGMAMLLGGLLWPPLALALAPIAWLFLTYTAEVVRLAALLPFASLDTGGWGGPFAALCYTALAAGFACSWLARAGRLPRLSRRAAGQTLACALPLLLGAGLLAGRPDGRLHIFFMEAGGGEAMTVVTPGGRSALLWDGRGDGKIVAAQARAHLPGWRAQPDVALSEPATGLWPDGRVPGRAPDLAPGQTLQLDAGVTLTRLAAGDEPAFLLKYGRFATLLPTALGQPGQAMLAAGAGAGERLTVTVLKAPGPGTGAWPAPAFVAAVDPQLVIWPRETTYPPEVTELLAERAAVRSEAGGVSEVATDGTALWLRQWGNELRR